MIRQAHEPSGSCFIGMPEVCQSLKSPQRYSSTAPSSGGILKVTSTLPAPRGRFSIIGTSPVSPDSATVRHGAWG